MQEGKRQELQNVKVMFYLANTAQICSELGLLESPQTFQQAWHKWPDKPGLMSDTAEPALPSLLWVIGGSASLGLALLDLKQGLIGS